MSTGNDGHGARAAHSQKFIESKIHRAKQREVRPMNIEKMETILQEMQVAEFHDLAAAHAFVKKWAERISMAITDHLIAELGDGGLIAAVELSTDPAGYDWDDT